jgi:hypothetical protein
MSKRARSDEEGNAAKRLKAEDGSPRPKLESLSPRPKLEDVSPIPKLEGVSPKPKAESVSPKPEEKQSPVSALAAELDSALTLASPRQQLFCLGPPIDHFRLFTRRLRQHPISDWDPNWVTALVQKEQHRLLWIDLDQEFSIEPDRAYICAESSYAEKSLRIKNVDAFWSQSRYRRGFSALGWCMFHLYNKCLRSRPNLLFLASKSESFQWGTSLWHERGEHLQTTPLQTCSDDGEELDAWSETVEIAARVGSRELSTGPVSTMWAWQRGFFAMRFPHAYYELRDLECVMPSEPIHTAMPFFQGFDVLYETVLHYVKDVPPPGSSLPIFTQHRLDTMFHYLLAAMLKQADQRIDVFGVLLSVFDAKVELGSLVFQYCSLL